MKLATTIRIGWLTAFLATSAGAQPVVSSSGENMRLRSSSVTAGFGGAWNVGLVMQDDNGNTSLSNGWRRWWHCQISNLSVSGETLSVTLSDAGYTDVILPVWALSTDGGATFGDYTRVPTSAVPTVSGPSSSATHRFTLRTPAGVTAIRLAKFFPYTVTDKNAWLASISGHASGRVRSITNLGNSVQGRPIEMVEFTEPSIPDADKKRIWIHSGIHPAENTSYFMVEGFVDFLLSNDPDAFRLLGNSIINVVMMANPDGVFLGNYRTTSQSDNIEDNWAAPYNNSRPEIVALRTRIEQYMGTVANPGSNPIEMLLNLHATHNITNPFHFRHSSNSNFNINSSRSGVVPSVNAMETQWINAFRARSPYVNLGATASSSCGAPVRPFVECMVHDRWSINPAWTGGSNNLEQVMAITFEGTYGRGPNGVSWNTQNDWRDVGEAMGRAMNDYFAFTNPSTMTASATSFGVACNGLLMTGSVAHTPPMTNVLTLSVVGAPAGSAGFLMFAPTQAQVPLPPPWNCPILSFVGGIPVPLTPPVTQLVVNVPPDPGLLINLQMLTAVAFGPLLDVRASAGVEVRNNF